MTVQACPAACSSANTASTSSFDHQVRKRAWLTVVEGETRIEAGGVVVKAGPGTLVTFEPGERHSVGNERGAQIILILSPLPGEGHYPVNHQASSN